MDERRGFSEDQRKFDESIETLPDEEQRSLRRQRFRENLRRNRSTLLDAEDELVEAIVALQMELKEWDIKEIMSMPVSTFLVLQEKIKKLQDKSKQQEKTLGKKTAKTLR